MKGTFYLERQGPSGREDRVRLTHLELQALLEGVANTHWPPAHVKAVAKLRRVMGGGSGHE